MATINKQPSGLYRAQVRRAGYPARSKSFRLESQAVAWAMRIEFDLDRGVVSPGTELRRKSVKDLFVRFRDKECPARKGGVREAKFIEAFLRSPRFPAAARLNQDLAPLFREWQLNREAAVSASTVNRELNLVSGVFSCAIKKWGEKLQVNPISLLQRPAVRQKGRERTWSGEDVERFRLVADRVRETGEARQVRDYAFPALVLGIETAMRLGEICRVLVSATDIERQVVLLEDTKNGDRRLVPLSARAVETLRPLLQEAVEGARDEVFPMSPEVLGVEFRKLRAQAGLVGIRFHDTRHTAVTQLATKLDNVLELGAVTGHRDLRSLKRYYHPSATDLAKKLG